MKLPLDQTRRIQLYKPPLQTQRKHTGTYNMAWLTAFTRLMTMLLTTEATSKDKAADLASH